MRRALRLAPLLLLATAARPADAAWSTSPVQHVQVSFATDGALQPAATSDGQGGAIVVWSEYHQTYPIYTLRAQRLSAAGAPLWSPVTVPVTTLPQGNQNDAQVVPDGAGGVIVAWSENPPAGNLRTRAQRLDANGVAQWGDSGVAIAPAHSKQFEFAMIGDGAGGASFAFVNHPTPSDTEVLAQRLAANGSRLWGDGGKTVCAAPGDRRYPAIALGPGGTSAVVWADERNQTEATFAQSLSVSGDTVWSGAKQLDATGTLDPRFVVSDGGSGWIVVWSDGSAGRAQRLDAAGNALWGPAGVAPFSTGVRTIRTAIADGIGGIILIARLELTAPPRWRATAQRLSSAGGKTWGIDGVRASTNENDQDPLVLVPIGAGGAIALWRDWRLGIFSTTLYAQRFSAGGARLWMAAGNPIDLTLHGVGALVGVPSGNAGAIAIWNPDQVFAHRIDGSGALGDPVGVEPPEVTLGLALERVSPNPSHSGDAVIRFRLPRASSVRVSIVDVRGAHVRTLDDAWRDAGAHAVSWDGLDDAGRRVGAGVYSVEVVTESERQSRKVVRLE